MATAKLFRAAVLACADDAIQDVPDNVEFRARCFIASLTGALAEAGEEALAAALRQVSARGVATGALLDGA